MAQQRNRGRRRGKEARTTPLHELARRPGTTHAWCGTEHQPHGWSYVPCFSNAEWADWELVQARSLLTEVRSLAEQPEGKVEHARELVRRLLVHGMWAWNWTQFHEQARSDPEAEAAFRALAPEELRARVAQAEQMLGAHATAALEPISSALDALAAAAHQRPCRLLRYPDPRPVVRGPHHPRVPIGSFIDTGRFVPGEILTMEPEAPFRMTLRFGDELETGFVPGLRDWRPVSPPTASRSLADLFPPGAWLRDDDWGYGQVQHVTTTTLVVDFPRLGRQLLLPDPWLTHIEQLAEPPVLDLRPWNERFPPGCWVTVQRRPPVVVLDSEADSLALDWFQQVRHLRRSLAQPAPWPADLPGLDLDSPWARRRRTWLESVNPRGTLRLLCPCCADPVVGNYHEELEMADRDCLLCGWQYDGRHESEASWERPASADDGDPDPNAGYSLDEARRNVQQHGHALRLDDPRATRFAATSHLRTGIRRLQEALRLHPHPSWRQRRLEQTLWRMEARLREAIPAAKSRDWEDEPETERARPSTDEEVP